MFPTQEKEKHKQQRMWAKGLGMKYSNMQLSLTQYYPKLGNMGGVKTPLTPLSL